MNKKEIGKYLKTLRIDRGYSRTDVAKVIGTTYKSILDWEGGVFPSDSRILLDLADLYEVTVDDLLECGKQITQEELVEKHPLFKPFTFGEKYNTDKDYYTPYQSKVLKTNNRLKELILLFRKRVLTRSEDYELRFLFDNMCTFTNYYRERFDTKKDSYICFLNLLKTVIKNTKTSNDYYFEVRKNITINKHPLSNPFPRYGVSQDDSIKDEQFKSLENWEKDSYLALIQNNDLILDPSNSVDRLNEYKECIGEEYNRDKATKKLIKYFIDNGAMLNPYFFSFIQKTKRKCSVLARLEDTYIDYIKPIFIHYHNPDDLSDPEYKYAYVQNNEYNRFLDNYFDYYVPFHTTKKSKPGEIYSLFQHNDENEVIDYLYQLKNLSFDDSNDLTKKAKVQYDLNNYLRAYEKYLGNVIEANSRLSRLEEIEKKLKNGEMYFYEYELVDISKNSDFNHFDSIEEWRANITYQEYLNGRDEQATKNLLDDLDKLSLEEIRNKYFAKEEVEMFDE